MSPTGIISSMPVNFLTLKQPLQIICLVILSCIDISMTHLFPHCSSHTFNSTHSLASSLSHLVTCMVALAILQPCNRDRIGGRQGLAKSQFHISLIFETFFMFRKEFTNTAIDFLRNKVLEYHQYHQYQHHQYQYHQSCINLHQIIHWLRV